MGSRILLVADAWDVMTTERPYQAAFSTSDAAAEMRSCTGSQPFRGPE